MHISSHTRDGLSTLVPTIADLDPGGPDNWHVLDEEGELLFAGSYYQAQVFMEAEGLRPDCNCELVDITAQQEAWYDRALGWA